MHMQGNKIVLDLEFTPIRDPDLQAVARSEILEIGAVKLNEQNAVLEEFQTVLRRGNGELYRLDRFRLSQPVLYMEQFRSERNSERGRPQGTVAARYVLHSLGGLAATASENVWIYPPDEPDQCTGLYADLFRGNGTRGVGRCQEHGEDPEAAEQLAGRAGANPAIPHHL